MTILILGGTAEARSWPTGWPRQAVTCSPRWPGGCAPGPAGGPGPDRRLRRGRRPGATSCAEQQISAVVDATHPFAAQISANAAAAAAPVGCPLLRLERPGWADHPRAGSWTWVADADAARARRGAVRAAVPDHRTPVAGGLPALGRPGGARPGGRSARVPAAAALDVITARGPYDYAGEKAIMVEPPDGRAAHQGLRRHPHGRQARRGGRPRHPGGDHRPATPPARRAGGPRCRRRA